MAPGEVLGGLERGSDTVSFVGLVASLEQVDHERFTPLLAATRILDELGDDHAKRRDDVSRSTRCSWPCQRKTQGCASRWKWAVLLDVEVFGVRIEGDRAFCHGGKPSWVLQIVRVRTIL